MPDTDKLMTIREMCDTYDVTPRTLRFYEAKELLSPLRDGQKRLFTAAIVVASSSSCAASALGFLSKKSASCSSFTMSATSSRHSSPAPLQSLKSALPTWFASVTNSP